MHAPSARGGCFVSAAASVLIRCASALLQRGHSRPETTLAEGAGKEILQSACTGCHEIGRVLRAGYSAQDWRTVLHMMRNVGAQLPDDQLGTLVTVSGGEFPGKGKGGRRDGPRSGASDL